MGKLIVSEFLTLDGVMQGPGGADEDRSGGFELGGWHMPYFDDVAGAAVDAAMAGAAGLVFGRRTYEIMAAYWPSAAAEEEDGAFAGTMNSLPKYVASTTLQPPLTWSNSTLLEGDAAAAVAKLKADVEGDLLIFGSGELVRSLMGEGVVDRFLLMVDPLVLGRGKRLFGEGGPPANLRLVDSQVTGTGALLLTYEFQSA